jgi:hypothetical protein
VITETPPDTPVTTPVPDPTVATDVVPLVHVPPMDMSVKVVVEPAQIVDSPVTALGTALTVTVFNA